MKEELKNIGTIESEDTGGLTNRKESEVVKNINGMTEEELENERLREENERLREEIERVRSLPFKERLYDRVNVSLKTMDIIIITLILLAIAATIVGMIQ